MDDGFVDFASLLDPVLAEQRKQKTQLTRTKKVVDDLKATSEEQEERLGSLETKQKNGIKSLVRVFFLCFSLIVERARPSEGCIVQALLMTKKELQALLLILICPTGLEPG